MNRNTGIPQYETSDPQTRMTTSFSSFLIVFLIACLLAACNDNGNSRHTLRWDGGPKINEAIFYLDEKFFGSGLEGFSNLLDSLRVLPEGAIVELKYPPEALSYYEDNYSHFTGLPLTGDEPEHKQWVKVAIERHLKFIE